MPEGSLELLSVDIWGEDAQKCCSYSPDLVPYIAVIGSSQINWLSGETMGEPLQCHKPEAGSWELVRSSVLGSRVKDVSGR